MPSTPRPDIAAAVLPPLAIGLTSGGLTSRFCMSSRNRTGMAGLGTGVVSLGLVGMLAMKRERGTGTGER